MAAGRAQLQGVGRTPVDERLTERIQGGGTRRWWGHNKRVGRCRGKVGRPSVPGARDERPRWHGRSGRTGSKEQRLFVRKWAVSGWRKSLFC